VRELAQRTNLPSCWLWPERLSGSAGGLLGGLLADWCGAGHELCQER
jgi:hypothetical protein